jgi:hypothetical protein
MKTIKFLALLLVSLVAIQTSSASSSEMKQVEPDLLYTLNLGDITDVNAEEINAKINEFLFSTLPSSPELRS